MKIWYKVHKWTNKDDKQIKRVDVVKETDKTLVIKKKWSMSDKFAEVREYKSSEYDQYFETYEQAYAFLKRRKESAIKNYKEKLADAEDDLKYFLENYETRPEDKTV